MPTGKPQRKGESAMDKNVTYEQLTRLAASVIKRIEAKRQEKERFEGEKHAKKTNTVAAD